MSRSKNIQDNKFKVLISPRQERVVDKKVKETKKTWVHRIIQWRLIGYIVIGVSLWKLNKDIETLSLQMFLLILFTELQSRGVSKQRIQRLKEELALDIEEPQYEDREKLRVEALHKQEQRDSQKSKQDIEENYNLQLLSSYRTYTHHD